MRTIPFEENGVRVVMGNSSKPILIAASRMSIEEARTVIASLQRAIRCYCLELDREALRQKEVTA